MTTRRHAPLLFALGAIAVVVALATIRYAPPAPVSADAPDREFSADRARAMLARVLSPERPHPVGSPEADAVRNRLLAALARLGIEADVQEAWLDAGAGRAMRVRNVVARLPGQRSRGTDERAILLAAHYDSVGAGPGASDDGIGVATLLEVARALRAGPPLERPVVLLFDEGEEAGLVGARAFVDDHPLASDLHAAINVEARGTRGPSLMFETGANNLALIRLLADNVARPVTSSLFETFYRAMPNDTDFTVFRRAGLSGYNFAIIGGAANYHTPNDDLAHADPASLQHHGDNVLALTRALARTADIRADRDAAYFDVLGFGVVAWPDHWTLPLAILGVLLVVANVFIDRQRAGLRRGVLVGAAVWVVATAVAIFAAYGLNALALPIHGWLLMPPRVGIASSAWCVGVAALLGLAAARIGFWPLWGGAWITIAVLGLVLAVAAPGAAYCLTLPAIVAGASGLLARTLRRDAAESLLAAVLPSTAFALLVVPIAFGLFDAFGPNIAGPVAPLAATLIPACAMTSRRTTAAIAIGGLSVAILVTAWVVASPHDRTTRPQRASLIHHRVADEAAQWYVAPSGRAVPGVVARALGTGAPTAFRADHRRAIVVAPIDGPAVDAAPAPTLEVLRSRPVARGRRFRVHVASPRGAPIVTVRLPDGFLYASAYVAVDGERMRIALPPPGTSGQVTVIPMPPEGAEIDVTIRPAEGAFRGLDVIVSDVTYGLPTIADSLRARRDTVAVPHRDGDVTIVSRVVRLPAE